MKKILLRATVKLLVIAVLVIGCSCLIMNVFAAGAYTITYKDANGTVLRTDSANAGDSVNLASYPSGAIAWVDTGANMSSVDPMPLKTRTPATLAAFRDSILLHRHMHTIF